MQRQDELVREQLVNAARRELATVQDAVTELAQRALDTGNPAVWRATLEQLVAQGEFARVTRASASPADHAQLSLRIVGAEPD